MRYYNRELGCYVELDNIDMRASREGSALKTASINRINRCHTVRQDKQRFVKSKWIRGKNTEGRPL